jgi:biopolymer transport protein ExbB
MKESIEETGRKVVQDLERYLNTLGTIAAVGPLLGLLGTVFGMIEIFAELMKHGSGDPAILAGGISEALISTAAGLTVAIPSLVFHRYFERLVDEYVVAMEDEALNLIDILHGDREVS